MGGRRMGLHGVFGGRFGAMQDEEDEEEVSTITS